MTTPAPIPVEYRDLIDKPLIGALGTTLPDGTPQVTPIWFDYEDGHILFNTAVGRLKDKAIRANPYVVVMVLDPNNPYRYIQIRGPVVEISEETGRALIDQLARRYTGAEKYTFGPPDERRVSYRMAPERVQVSG